MDIPNVALGFLAAANPGAVVVDLNTFPSDPERLFRFGDYPHDIRFSVQSRSVSVAQGLLESCRQTYPQATVGTVLSPIDVQCCYPFVIIPSYAVQDVRLVPLAVAPRYSTFDSYPMFAEQWSSGAWPYAVFTSWGCPFACTYCAARRRAWHARPIANLMAELVGKRDHIRAVSIIDDVFNLHRDHVHQVCQVMQDIGLEWMCTNGLRADLLGEIQAREMERSGCTTVGFGMETADDGLLKAIQKGETLAEIETGIRIARDHFASVSVYIILGLPGSSYDLDRRTVDWCVRQGVYVSASFYQPPGSESPFYGDHALPAGLCGYNPQVQHSTSMEQIELMNFVEGLSWRGRNVGECLAARVRLTRRYGSRVAGQYLKMDARKVWRWARR